MSSKRTALKEFIEFISDRKWHEIYDFHFQHGVSPLLIIEVMDFMVRNDLIVREGRSVRLSPDLSNAKIALLNRLRKTQRPSVLDEYNPKTLTGAHRYV